MERQRKVGSVIGHFLFERGSCLPLSQRCTCRCCTIACWLTFRVRQIDLETRMSELGWYSCAVPAGNPPWYFGGLDNFPSIKKKLKPLHKRMHHNRVEHVGECVWCCPVWTDERSLKLDRFNVGLKKLRHLPFPVFISQTFEVLLNS